MKTNAGNKLKEEFMDMEILRKKISTFRGEGGRVRITDDTLLMEILMTWEEHRHSAKSLVGKMNWVR